MFLPVFCFLLCTNMFNEQTENQSVTVNNCPVCEPVILHEDTVNVVEKNELFNVVLEENLSTGYTWRFKVSENNAVELIDTWCTPEKNLRDSKVGEPILRTWQFKALVKGRYRLTFLLKRQSGIPSDVKVFDLFVK